MHGRSIQNSIKRQRIYKSFNNYCYRLSSTTEVDSTVPLLAIVSFGTLAGLCGWAGRFGSWLDGNPGDRFSRDEALKSMRVMTVNTLTLAVFIASKRFLKEM